MQYHFTVPMTLGTDAVPRSPPTFVLTAQLNSPTINLITSQIYGPRPRHDA